MSLFDYTPESWPRFVSLTRQHMPRMPQMARTRTRDRQIDISRGWGALSTLLGAAGINIPDEVGDLVTAGTSDSVAGAVQSVVEGEILSRVAGGTIIGGGVETLRGGYQQLGRTDEMSAYLLGMMGYVKTLGGMAVSAMMDRRHDVAYPMPLIPPDIDRSGALYSSGRKAKYRAGAEAAWRVIQAMDNIRPASSNEDFYSKVCLTHIAIQTGQTSAVSLGTTRMRNMCARVISRSILNADLNAQAAAMRRWAVSGR